MYKGKMYCADFEENTITIEVEGEFSVRAGDYVLLSVEEYEKLSKLHQPTVSESVCVNCGKPIELHSKATQLCPDRFSHFEQNGA